MWNVRRSWCKRNTSPPQLWVKALEHLSSLKIGIFYGESECVFTRIILLFSLPWPGGHLLGIFAVKTYLGSCKLSHEYVGSPLRLWVSTVSHSHPSSHSASSSLSKLPFTCYYQLKSPAASVPVKHILALSEFDPLSRCLIGGCPETQLSGGSKKCHWLSVSPDVSCFLGGTYNFQALYISQLRSEAPLAFC